MTQQFRDTTGCEKTVAAARDWVVRLASADMTASDMQRFKDWLAQSPAHRDVFEKERSFWQRLGGLKAASGPQNWGEASPAVHRPAPRPVIRTRRRTVLAGALMAACIAFLVLFGGDIGSALMADYRTGVGEQRTVMLPDGSTVHLNTGTAIAVAFDSVERRVELLTGEALFEVAPDPTKPFRVAAADGVTQAVGTAFVVRTGDDGASVTVTAGVTSVTSPAGASNLGATVMAGAGQRTSYSRGHAPRLAEAIDAATAATWRHGVIRIDDLSLDAALAELDRYRPGRIVLMGGGTVYQSVSGAFDVTNLDAAIAGLAATHGLKVTKITPYLLILR